MRRRDAVARAVPEPVKRLIRPVRDRLRGKDDAEFAYWRSRHADDNGRFNNAHYERLMLGMAGEPSDAFLAGTVVADFGCGPRGSLVWARSAAVRIGIDVLADRYAEEFPDDITSHGMVYVKSTEKVIPLGTGSVDVVFTLNALDHVDEFPAMCGEVVRILKPGGEFIGSFNLGEPATRCEPQCLDEDVIGRHLLSGLEVVSYRACDRPREGSQYAPFFSDDEPSYTPGSEGTLWVRARKPGGG